MISNLIKNNITFGNESIMNEASDIDLNSDEPITDENPDGEEKAENKNKASDIDLNSDEPITDENPDGDGDSTDDSGGDEEDVTYDDGSSELTDSLSSKISKLQSTIDKDLDIGDIELRSKNLYKSFNMTYEILGDIYDLFGNTIKLLNVEDEYKKTLSEISEVKDAVYSYMILLYKNKPFLDNKSFLTDVFIYLLELNKTIIKMPKK